MEPFDALGRAFEPVGSAFGRIVLLDTEPTDTAVETALDECMKVHDALPEGTELELAARILLLTVALDAYQSIRVAAELTFLVIVLYVDYGDAALVLGNDHVGLETGIVRPAGIEFHHHIAGSSGGEDIVVADGAVRQLRKLEIVIVIKQLETGGLDLRTYLTDLGDGLLELVGIHSGPAGFVHVREGYVLHSEDGVFLYDLVDVVHHNLERNVVGKRNEAQFGAHPLDIYDGIAGVLIVELHAGIAQVADLLESAVEILLQIVPDAVQLETDGIRVYAFGEGFSAGIGRFASCEDAGSDDGKEQ